MDAMQSEGLTPEGFWRLYVGEASPLTFMNRLHSPDPREAAEEYVAKLPHLWGIVRRYTWKSSFEAPWQFRKGEIAAALTAHLEATEDEWRARLDQSPPEPYAPPVEYAPTPMPEHTGTAYDETGSAPQFADPVPKAVVAVDELGAVEELSIDELPGHEVALDDLPSAEGGEVIEGAVGDDEVQA